MLEYFLFFFTIVAYICCICKKEKKRNPKKTDESILAFLVNTGSFLATRQVTCVYFQSLSHPVCYPRITLWIYITP